MVTSDIAAASGLPRGGRTQEASPLLTSDQPIEQYGPHCPPAYGCKDGASGMLMGARPLPAGKPTSTTRTSALTLTVHGQQGAQ
ncbi:hypothetical protein ElyMa_004449300 [Elysia marginata]|uniref:Uncharacterized protein n=1 Tax=Elysia marginata TaxID=1093978 RepID=A0AAV4HHW0_9GAST|nr:hypothetical protein ElyMa_004449300 [Elysia marginata]